MEIILASGAQALNCSLGRAELCQFKSRWGLSDETTVKALQLGEWYHDTFRSNLWIISGYRTPAEQLDLIRRHESGDPSVPVRPAPPERSDHCKIPAKAFDVGYDLAPPRETENAVATYATAQLGLGWGGTFPEPDPRHFYWSGGG